MVGYQPLKTGCSLTLLPDLLAICRLPAGSPSPGWAQSSSLLAFIHTPDELSVVCDLEAVPDDIIAERGWRAFVVQGPLDFALVGVLATLAAALAAAGVSIFALSTFDTDYILVREGDVEAAVHALQANGHKVIAVFS